MIVCNLYYCENKTRNKSLQFKPKHFLLSSDLFRIMDLEPEHNGFEISKKKKPKKKSKIE